VTRNSREIIGITMGFGGCKIQIVGNVFQCRRNVVMSARAKPQFGVFYTARRRSLHGRLPQLWQTGVAVLCRRPVAEDVSGVRRYADAFIEWDYYSPRRRKSRPILWHPRKTILCAAYCGTEQ